MRSDGGEGEVEVQVRSEGTWKYEGGDVTSCETDQSTSVQGNTAKHQHGDIIMLPLVIRLSEHRW